MLHTDVPDGVVVGIPRSQHSKGNLKQRFLVVLLMLVSAPVVHAVISFLLLTSGDVEQNPGPEQGLL